MARQLDGERSRPGQVHHVEPVVQTEGREGLAEIRNGEEVGQIHQQDTRELSGGLEVERDAHPTASRRSVLY